MDDLQLYIYLALAIIYFIARALKPSKNKKPPVGRQHAGQDADAPDIPDKERPLSFEELLEEFTGERSARKRSMPEEEEEEIEVHQANEATRVDDEYQSYEEYDDNKTGEYAQYEQQYQPAKELKTIDEQVSLEAPIEKAFEEYEIQRDVSHRAVKYRELLLNQESLKDAILLKEMLEPKYF